MNADGLFPKDGFGVFQKHRFHCTTKYQWMNRVRITHIHYRYTAKSLPGLPLTDFQCNNREHHAENRHNPET